jgi:hypothetical protein
MRWNNPTGGLWWHSRALLNRHRWQKTVDTMRDWLIETSPQAPRLVIIGASAGWMLSRCWLSRFKEIQTWDIDPWAGPLFKLMHSKSLQNNGIRWRHHQQDFWQSPQAWQEAGPETIYWFDNVLGQLPLVMLIEQAQQRIDDLQRALSRSHWGSVHDRFSGPIQGGLDLPRAWHSESGVHPSSAQAQDWLKTWGARGDWSDHLTSHVFRAGTQVLNVPWQFNAHTGHWLEMGWQAPA